jgi:DNA polymerase-4
MRFVDYTRATRSATMLDPTAQTDRILGVASGLLEASRPLIEERGLTLLGIALANLCDEGGVQLVLPFERSRALDETIDLVRARFGAGAITRGVLVGRDPGQWVPLLPD